MRQLHRRWQDQGPKGTATMLLQILLYAAAPLCSLYAACARWRDAPGDQAVRDALAALRSAAKTRSNSSTAVSPSNRLRR